MATIIKRNIKGVEYYYFSYSYREKTRVLKKEKYIGVKLPSDDVLFQLWEEFSNDIAEERWIPTIESITKVYRNAVASIPESIRIKNLRNFGIRFTHHSNKIEGSTLTLRDVQTIIDSDVAPKNKPASDVIEAKAHMKIYEEMIKTKKELSIELILEWHRELFQLTQPDVAGIVRDYPVSITGTNFEPPMYKIEINRLLQDLFKWYEGKKSVYHPIFIASIMHYRFVAIHPFGDGNGRMARLLTNYILYKKEYPMFDISAKIRNQYYKALETTDKLRDHFLPFIQWFFTQYLKTNKIYLEQ